MFRHRMDRAARPAAADVKRVTLVLLACCGAAALHAGDLHVVVRDAKQQGVADVVVIATPAAATTPAQRAVSARATMDQRDLTFVPDVLVVQTGTAISFPNHDIVKHQVYSFSPAKSFQLPLYVGKVYPPLVFDKPGIVTIGCNIHDSMLGFIYVTDSPWFGKTDANGAADIAQLPPGVYDIALWHPRQNDAPTKVQGKVSIDASGTAQAQFVLPALRAAPNHNSTKKWNGY
jgi:plastocyanin